MGANTIIEFSPERKLHVKIMRSIAQDFKDIPMVLKGGTALLLCYGLDRFSEDLDFDAPKKFNIAGRVERILLRYAKGHELKIVKDTETVQRFKAHYTGVASDRLLKIETSFRTSPDEKQVVVIDGIRTYVISALIEQKINALTHRTAARDLYDISFLTRTYPNDFLASSIQKLAELVHDVNAVEQRFEDAFEEDEILNTQSLSEIILQIAEFLQNHHIKN